jgi:ubiquinol-cytochrome c reductase cytochrome c1 subunit
MKRFILALAGLTLSVAAVANEGEKLPFSFKPDTANLGSVQRGARDFMAYCSGCHSMKHLRYSRIAQDLGIPEELVKKNLMFTSDKIGDHIISSMPAEQSQHWFGQTPPDLTVETRVRGSDWVYSYLNSFYADDSRPLGVNNTVLPNASMPHVLWELQGWQVKPDAKAEGAEHEDWNWRIPASCRRRTTRSSPPTSPTS